jgi:hypothetical protein
LPISSPPVFAALHSDERSITKIAAGTFTLLQCSPCIRVFHCGDGAMSMTMQFIDGFLAAMLPSMFTVAWMVWRAA